MKKHTIYTIGHSTRPIDEFNQILHAYEIKLLVDVRTIPGSRRNPQFNANELKKDLEQHEIGYTPLKELGGLRHTTKASINTGWTNLSFRGFADYMQTAEFTKGIALLIEMSKLQRTTIMCAEAVPWRCHRSLIGDALVIRGVLVEDILGEKTSKPHQLTPWARVAGTTITYPEAAPSGEAG